MNVSLSATWGQPSRQSHTFLGGYECHGSGEPAFLLWPHAWTHPSSAQGPGPKDAGFRASWKAQVSIRRCLLVAGFWRALPNTRLAGRLGPPAFFLPALRVDLPAYPKCLSHVSFPLSLLPVCGSRAAVHDGEVEVLALKGAWQGFGIH